MCLDTHVEQMDNGNSETWWGPNQVGWKLAGYYMQSVKGLNFGAGVLIVNR